MKKTLLLIFCCFINFAVAQWSSDPNQNLMICDLNGEQALAKIAMTSDGGCYISWFDTRSGAYNVYLQRLDPLGYKMWAVNGLLISNHPQNTFLTDYDLICDQNNNAVLVFSDTRSGGLLKPVAYKISPDGNFLWGADGIDISSSDSFQASPTLTETSDGNYVFAWVSADGSQKIALQKLSQTGQKLWGTTPILIQSATENYSYPAVVKSDNGQIILIHTVQTGGFPPEVRIRAHKLDANGQLLWGSNGVMIQDNGQMAFFQVPEVESDGNNGALIAWYDGRAGGNLSSSFVQRISSAGTLYFPANGAEGSLAAQRNKFYPQIAFNLSTKETYILWVETNSGQSQNGIYGQKFSPTGNRIWGNTGMVFVPLSAPNTISISDLSAHMGSNQIDVFYLESNASGLNSKTMGFACDTSGALIWPGNIVTLSNPTTEKLQMETAMDVYENCKLVWGDKRLDASGIYAQDINPSGQLGQPVVPVELSYFSASVDGSNVLLSWTTSSESNNMGFEVERLDIKTFTNDQWKQIGFVHGNGTSTERNYYQFTDEELSQGVYKYRLKQIDFDGTFQYSNEVEISVLPVNDLILYQNYPNPFNPTTTISFQLPMNSYVTLKIYDMVGSEIATLFAGQKSAGSYEVEFSVKGGSASGGNAYTLPSGIYFYQLQAGLYIESKKMILLK